jgi:hypothetical protein
MDQDPIERARQLDQKATQAAELAVKLQASHNDAMWDLADHFAKHPEVAKLSEFREKAAFIRDREEAVAADLSDTPSLRERARAFVDRMREAQEQSMKQTPGMKP